MAKRELERTVQPSILDRLSDEDPRSSADPRVSYVESLRQFKMGVQRDLEWLLNTRRTLNSILALAGYLRRERPVSPSHHIGAC